ncbi:hypothetical protein ACFYTC_06905 [Actinomadura nitritigenes]|uniref:hypothetical protein n=1 Tax=Actinomadura nitritigenes TaxID=134602 RepID=UPI0036B0DF03
MDPVALNGRHEMCIWRHFRGNKPPAIESSSHPREHREAPSRAGLDLLKVSLDYLRTDIMTGRDIQLRIIQSYSTVLASIMIGGLVYAGKAPPPPDPDVLLALFGIAIPGFSIVSSAAFMGEMLRIGRAAAAARGIEWWVSRNETLCLHGEDDRLLSPLFVEAFYRATGRRQRSTRGYGTASYYFAIMAIFGGGLTLSLSLYNILLWSRPGEAINLFGANFRASIFVTTLWLVMWIFISTALGRKIRALAEHVPDIIDETIFGPSQ